MGNLYNATARLMQSRDYKAEVNRPIQQTPAKLSYQCVTPPICD